MTCQAGHEGALKGELSRRWPTFRFAYSRPGFVTFKLPDDHGLSEDFDLESTFIRAYGFSLGRVQGNSPEALAEKTWRLAGVQEFRHLHVWPRIMPAGEHGYARVHRRVACRRSGDACESLVSAALIGPADAQHAASARRRGRHALASGSWGIIRRTADRRAGPAGMHELELPEDAVSRAWLKMEEALRWSRLPVRPGQEFVEIGCAPGGSCQALLSRNLGVVGIDPAAVDERVLEHENFTHVRKRRRRRAAPGVSQGALAGDRHERRRRNTRSTRSRRSSRTRRCTFADCC